MRSLRRCLKVSQRAWVTCHACSSFSHSGFYVPHAGDPTTVPCNNASAALTAHISEAKTKTMKYVDS